MRMLYLTAFSIAALCNQSHGAIYAVDVDFSNIISTTQPLHGVNKSVLGEAKTGELVDYSYLYQKTGIASVRTHDDWFDICKLYTAATLTLYSSGSGTPAGCSSNLLTGNGSTYLDWEEISYMDPVLNPNYTFTTTPSLANDSYNQLLALNIEPYVRLGESWDGPNYVTTPITWGRVADKIIGHFESFGLPGFYEVWNEPDGIFWTGPNVMAGTSDTEFGNFYATAYSQFSPYANAPIGGSGFAQGGMEEFYQKIISTGSSANSFVGDALSAAGEANFAFISSHFYGKYAMAGPTCGTMTRTECMANYLENIRSAIDTHFTSADVTPPPLHITEWAIDHPGSCHSSASYTNWLANDCINQMSGTFLSFGITMMQQPALYIQRAHYYDGYSPSGLYLGAEWTSAVNDVGFYGDCNGACQFATNFSTTGDFAIRVTPAALNMYLHDGMENRKMPFTYLEKTSGGSTVGSTIMLAAKNNWPVTAYAAGEPDSIILPPIEKKSIVVTNNEAVTRMVTVKVSGLVPSTTYNYNAEYVYDIVHGGVFVDVAGLGTYANPYTPDNAQVDAVWSTYVHTSTGTANTNPSGDWSITISMQPNEVRRIDLTRQRFPIGGLD